MNTKLLADIDLSKPLLLRPDNFTPLARTPWAGSAIASKYKCELVPESAGKKIGEAWEFSCDPCFPSKLQDYPFTLAELFLARAPEIFGPVNSDKRCELLVKLINASDPLSVQVHPRDDDPDLKSNECGKPESWYVLDVEPGAGIYLGFSRKMSRDELRTGLLSGNGRELLQFVTVKPGDYFEIEPGVAHCIGPGVTLLEPQRIVEGLSGKTFRMWDFDRRYDAAGQVDMVNGKARDLHLEEGLKLVDPMVQSGPDWLATLRRKPNNVAIASGISAEIFPANDFYQTIIIRADRDSEFKLPIANSYAAVTVLSGEFRSHDMRIPKGMSALVPADAFPLTLKSKADSTIAVLCPAFAEIGVR
jgi:mannose-6-phosphate isomerase